MSGDPTPKNWKDFIPYVVWGSLVFSCGMVAIEKMVEQNYGQTLVALVSGGGIAAVAIHSKTWLGRTSPNLAFAAAAVLTLTVLLNPFVEERRWPFSAWFPTPTVGDAQSSSRDNAAAAQLRAERDNAFAQRDEALAKLATVTKERDEQKQMIAALQIKNDSLRFGQNTDKTPTASIPEPITWSNRLLFYSGGDKTIKYIVLYGTNNGYTPQQLKTATLSSDITGETRRFSIEVPTHRIDAAQIELVNINPVPPGAEIELIIEWKPVIAVSDFMSQWGKAQLEINYGGVTHKMTFDQEHMRASLAEDIVGADVVVGVPRVTPKAP